MDCDRCKKNGCIINQVVTEEINRFVDNWPFDYITTKHIIAARNAFLQDCPDFKPIPETANQGNKCE